MARFRVVMNHSDYPPGCESSHAKMPGAGECRPLAWLTMGDGQLSSNLNSLASPFFTDFERGVFAGLP